MSQEPEGRKLENPPIVEAILDIDCDMAVDFELGSIEERAKQVFANGYPKTRRKMLQEHQIRAAADARPEMEVQVSMDALQFLRDDERQLVQVRRRGFSFNRLAPYTSLDDYLPEIERRWNEFRELASAVQVRRIALRYINRILIPTVESVVELNDYLRFGPRLVDEEGQQVLGFFNQQSVREARTEHLLNTTMVMQEMDGDRIPVIFDIEAMHLTAADPAAWHNIREVLLSLRRLKNATFWSALTDKCLNLFH